MNLYQVPPDVKEKEKVIGGLFDWGQFFWMLGGAGIAIVLFSVSYMTLNSEIFSLILGVIGLTTCLPFVFVKKKGLTLFRYLTLKRKLRSQKGDLANKRKEVIE
ncbi:MULTISPECIES: PrgI family mobile element protein [unclassified Exiguobacterium]|uniref:PrgI family mobile element protein n=1 Tax=unclassified Exiguobacterium TaxID=2644629 RepID=UPI001BEAA646|nr:MULTISPECIES: PrgI family protein [unclassified Exiguobacterium]